MNLPFFAVKAYVPGGVQNQGGKKFEKCLPAGTGTNIYFSSTTAIVDYYAVVFLVWQGPLGFFFSTEGSFGYARP